MICDHLNLNNCIIEGDAINIIKMLNAIRENLSHLGALLDDFEYYMSLDRIIDIVWVRRTCNQPAHTLANQAKFSEEPKLWTSISDCILALVLEDMVHE